MLNKNDIHNIDIIDLSFQGSGVAKIDEFIIFIDGALPGDFCEIKILKVKKNYAFGKILNIIKPSTYRVGSKCPVFSKCGGCSLQHLEYSQQLIIKQKKVENCLRRIANLLEVDVKPCVGLKAPYHYRNKVQYPVREINNELKIGFYQKNSHNIVDFYSCFIQNPVNEEIINIIKSHMVKYNITAYNEENNTGVVRHIFIRVAHITKEIMVCIVVKGKNSNIIKNKSELIKSLNKIPNMVSIVLNYNNDKTNVIMGQKVDTLFGKQYIIDYIDNISFKISAKSFYQVNSVQTERLYKQIIKLLNIDNSKTVLDAYCGIGTISLFIAKYAKKVYGVEIVSEAIYDAIENAKINNVNNTEFILGKAEEVIPNRFDKETIDIVILDPPRKGCHEDLLNSVISINPEKIIYVSCEPSTLARDLKLLCQHKYNVTNVIPYDFFPQTMHVETLVLLTNKV